MMALDYQAPSYSVEQIAKEWMIETFGFYMERWTVTPDEAKELLDDAGKNRKLKVSGIDKYSSAMKKKKWALSYQGLSFNEEGKLMDGQHRLQAVIDSGTPTDFVVFLNVPHDTPIDNGIPRSSADSIVIRGLLPYEEGMQDNISMVNALFNAVLGLGGRKILSITDDDRVAFIKKYHDEINAARLISYKGDARPLTCKAPVRAAILAALIVGEDPDELNNFAECVNSGFFTDSSQKAACILRNALQEMKLSGGYSRMALESVSEEAIFDFMRKKPRTKKYKGIAHPYSSKINLEEII